MSDVMLHGVLNMPPDLWSGDPMDVMQRHGRYVQASERIQADADELERKDAAIAELVGALKYVMDDEPSGIPRASSSCRAVVAKAIAKYESKQEGK